MSRFCSAVRVGCAPASAAQTNVMARIRALVNPQFYKLAASFVREIAAAGDKCHDRWTHLTIQNPIPVLVLFAALAGTSLGQQAAKPVATVKKAAAKPQPASAHAAQTDAQIEKAIRARFADSKINEDKFEVHVQGGRATLTGNTNVLQHKGTATRLAHAAGATDVVNNIEPSDEAREKAATNLTKGRRRAQVKRTETVARSESR